jgi:hypothetical protein
MVKVIYIHIYIYISALEFASFHPNELNKSSLTSRDKSGHPDHLETVPASELCRHRAGNIGPVEFCTMKRQIAPLQLPSNIFAQQITNNHQKKSLHSEKSEK